jgi:hypothetical protein
MLLLVQLHGYKILAFVKHFVIVRLIYFFPVRYLQGNRLTGPRYDQSLVICRHCITYNAQVEQVEQDAVQNIARAALCFDNHACIFKFSPNLGKIIGCTQSWVAKTKAKIKKDGMKVSQDIQPNGGAWSVCIGRISFLVAFQFVTSVC